MSTRPGILSGTDYLNLPSDQETWLLKPLIPSGGAALVYGDSKIGKTFAAIQLSLALSGAYDDWLGFAVVQPGPICYLQFDTPRSLFTLRLADLRREGLPIHILNLADRETLEFFPFDILQPQHTRYLRSIIAPFNPVAVVIDTLREVHSGDEDSSTVMRNVISNLVAATTPAALILISHARKPNIDTGKNLMADMRGSSYVVGRMDAIMRFTRKGLYYQGRAIEEGHIKLSRQDNGLWLPDNTDDQAIIEEVLVDASLTTMRAQARVLAIRLKKSEEAAMSQLRRIIASGKLVSHVIP